MTMRHSDSAAETRSKQLRFDRYVLDVDRGCLLLDGNEIRLRPKTFAVLSYLAANSGRLVSKDELFAAVWANVAVTDDALVQSIGELRRALGDDGSRLIKTIPRRGYRFESDVSAVSIDQASANAAPVSAAYRDAAQTPKPVTGPRIGLFALFTLAVLLTVGVLWSGETGWKFLNDFGYAGRSTAKIPETGAKPAIAVLPFLNQSDDSAREYF